MKGSWARTYGGAWLEERQEEGCLLPYAIQENAQRPQHWPIGQSDGGIFSFGLPLSRWLILFCQADKPSQMCNLPLPHWNYFLGGFLMSCLLLRLWVPLLCETRFVAVHSLNYSDPDFINAPFYLRNFGSVGETVPNSVHFLMLPCCCSPEQWQGGASNTIFRLLCHTSQPGPSCVSAHTRSSVLLCLSSLLSIFF